MISAIDKARARLSKQTSGGTGGGSRSTANDSGASDHAAPLDFDDCKVKLPPDVEGEIENESKFTDAQRVDELKKQVLSARKVLLESGAQTQYGDFVLLGVIGGRYSSVEIESEAGTDFIRATMPSASKKMPPKGEVENICVEIRNSARNGNRKVVIHQRIARTMQGRLLDIGDNEGNVVVVTRDGWGIEKNSSVAFLRGRSYGALPTPIRAPSARSAFKNIFEWLVSLGIPKSRAPLVIATLVAWLRTGNAYPLLLLFGSPGTGKTTAGRLLLSLIDPNDSLSLPSIKTDSEHIAAAAQHKHILTFDNESKLSAAEQDTFCTCATGGEIVRRKLYRDSDVAIMPIHRPVLITAVQPVITRPDLISRTVPVEFSARSVRRGDDEILNEFLQMRPELLGALLELLILGECHE